MSKILVADDSDVVRKIARRSLEQGGHSIVEAHDGSEAVALALSEMPQLILLDAEMPEMDGLEACKAIKSNPRTASIPVIICSGDDLSGEGERLRESGVAAYVPKPYSPADLLAKVAELLGN